MRLQHRICGQHQPEYVAHGVHVVNIPSKLELHKQLMLKMIAEKSISCVGVGIQPLSFLIGPLVQSVLQA
jgi:hypothetical protein